MLLLKRLAQANLGPARLAGQFLAGPPNPSSPPLYSITPPSASQALAIVKFLLRNCYRSVTGLLQKCYGPVTQVLRHRVCARALSHKAPGRISGAIGLTSCKLEAGKAGSWKLPREINGAAGSWKLHTSWELEKSAPPIFGPRRAAIFGPHIGT